MKKKLLLLIVILAAGPLSSQTLNQTTTWPNAGWTLTGSYNSGNLLLNPTTTDSNFKFDDNQVANTGDIIYLQSPLIDLSTAFSAGEKALKISFNLSYALTPSSSEMIGIQYWDADASAWIAMPNVSVASGSSVGTYTSCTGVLDDEYFDFSAFTLNQQQNFKYRFFYDDGGLSKGKGICIAAPTVISLSCSAPSSLHTTQILINGVSIGWTANGESNWEIEYGLQGFTLGTGTVQLANINSGTVNGLTQNTSYDIYVRADCSGGNQDFYSNYSSRVNFTTLATCPVPNTAIASNIATTSANISWLKGGSETTWNVEYGNKGYTQGSVNAIGQFVSTDNTTNALSNLTPGQFYNFYVQADCGGGDKSVWAGPFTFSTIWLNLQSPASGNILVGSVFTVLAQIWVDGLTNQPGQGTGISAWIGFNNADTHPSTWPTSSWIVASYNVDSGNNDEYKADIGSAITTSGTYYYASRFQTSSGTDLFGGLGGVYDGISNKSGVLTVSGTLGVNEQTLEGFSYYPNPVNDKLFLSANQNIDQVELYNLLGQQIMMVQPSASTYQINVSNLNTGIYFMKVKVADKIKTYKIVRQ